MLLYKKDFLLAVSGEGEVGGCLLRESINVLQSSAVFHSSEDGSALTNINFVCHHRGDGFHLWSSHCHQGVSSNKDTSIRPLFQILVTFLYQTRYM